MPARRAGRVGVLVRAPGALHSHRLGLYGLKEAHRTPRYWFDSRRLYFTKNHGRTYATLALLARLAGGGLHHLRCLVTGRSPEDEGRFYHDLAEHALTARRSALTAKDLNRGPVAEDRP